MQTPAPPVELVRRFRPPFCPRRTCADHRTSRPDYRAAIQGYYATRRFPRIPRYLCPTCGSTFSRQAFSTSYYLKRPELLRHVAAQLVGGSAHRQIARNLECAPSTVTRLAYRIGRHCLLLAEEAGRALWSDLPDEPVVLDHFETFEFTQDLPLGVATAVGQQSWWVYGIDPAPHRRAGTITPAQRRRLARRRPRPTRGGYTGSTRRVIDRLLAADSSRRLRLVSDGHRAYRRVVRTHPEADRIDHRVHPNPDRGPKGSPRSAEAVRRDRALFAVDMLHGLTRHSQKAHGRETIAFGRRLNAILLRFHLLQVWRNYVKGLSERKPDRSTPAMAVGLTDRPWTWRQVLARRRFPERLGLSGVPRELYDLDWTTPELPVNARHALRLAY